MSSTNRYIETLQAEGIYHFTTSDAADALEVSPTAARAALRRLKKKAVIASPYRGFHVIVPPEYRRLGCRPAEHFIPDLMEYLDEPYYVGLLSAASYYGAAHQKPMLLQVITRKRRRGLTCGAVRVNFFARQDMPETTVTKRNTQTGILRVSSPEATALELVGYIRHSGGLDNVTTVLAELAEGIDQDRLQAEASRSPVSWSQRLGYILNFLGADDLAKGLHRVLRRRSFHYIALAPSVSMVGAKRDHDWKLAANVALEPDL